MFYIKIAELLVEIDNLYDAIKEKCKDYIVEPDREPDLRVKTTYEFLDEWIHILEEENTIKMGLEKDRYLLEQVESACLHWQIYPKLPQLDAAWIHACVVDVDGEGYGFTAPSGYGKTTQSLMWLNYFGKRARIINGDNPIIRIKDGVCFAYGTPFCGSEGYNVNTCVPLKGLCYLNHSKENRIIRMDPAMAFSQILRLYQIYDLLLDNNQDHVMKMWEIITEQVPVWQLYCDISIDAVETAFSGMNT